MRMEEEERRSGSCCSSPRAVTDLMYPCRNGEKLWDRELITQLLNSKELWF